MSLELGELVVEIDARTKELQSGLRDATRKLTRFETKANKSTKRVAASFAKLGAGIGVAGAAIGALATGVVAYAGLRFAKHAIAESAAIESLGVRLEVLTGTTEGAAQAMADVKALVTETPYGLKELGTAASAVAVIFGENTDAVSEFTGIAADLASAFGKPVEQIGENLTRAFSSGLGAADALREAGISAEILKITGETDVAKISSEQLAEALRKMTEEGGKAFEAAAKRAQTLEGAISNTGIAADLMAAALGDALSPAVVAVGIEVIQPFFKDLQKLIEDNEGTITDYAVDALPKVIDAFVWLAEALGGVFKAMGAVGKAWKWAKAVGATLQHTVVEIVSWFKILWATFKTGLKIIGAVGRGLFALQTRDVAGMRQAVEDGKAAFEAGTGDINTALAEVAAAAEVAEETIAAAMGPDDGVAGIFEDIGKGIQDGAKFLDDFNTKLKKTTDQVKKAAKAARAAGPGPEGDTGRGRSDLGKVFDRGETRTAQERFDIDYEAEQAEKKAKAAAKATRDASFGGQLGQKFEDEMAKSLNNVFSGGKVNFKGFASDMAGDVGAALQEKSTEMFIDSIKDAFGPLVDDLKDLMKDKLGDAFEGMDLGGLGDALGDAFGMAAGAVMGLISGAIGGTKKRQTFAQIQGGGVTETQEVRGVIAGPQNIAIAEVGGAIADAWIEPTMILRESLFTQQAMLAVLSGGGGDASSLVESEATTTIQSSTTLY